MLIEVKNPQPHKSVKPNSKAQQALGGCRLAPLPSGDQLGLADSAGVSLLRLRYSGRAYRPDIIVPLCGPVTQRQIEHLIMSLLSGGSHAQVPAEQPTKSSRPYPADRQQFLLLPRAGAAHLQASESVAGGVANSDNDQQQPLLNASVDELITVASRLRSLGAAGAGSAVTSEAAGPAGVSMSELAAFGYRFRRRREELNYSQLDVALALKRLYNWNTSQGMISRFELADLSLENMASMWPLLRRWLVDLEAREVGGPEVADSIVAAAANAGAIGFDPSVAKQRKNKRKRCRYTGTQLLHLERHFLHTPTPSRADCIALSRRLNLSFEVIRNWFCNRRQKERLATEQLAESVVTADTIQSELAAAMVGPGTSVMLQ